MFFKADVPKNFAVFTAKYSSTGASCDYCKNFSEQSFCGTPLVAAFGTNKQQHLLFDLLSLHHKLYLQINIDEKPKLSFSGF